MKVKELYSTPPATSFSKKWEITQVACGITVEPLKEFPFPGGSRPGKHLGLSVGLLLDHEHWGNGLPTFQHLSGPIPPFLAVI